MKLRELRQLIDQLDHEGLGEFEVCLWLETDPPSPTLEQIQRNRAARWSLSHAVETGAVVTFIGRPA